MLLVVSNERFSKFETVGVHGFTVGARLHEHKRVLSQSFEHCFSSLGRRVAKRIVVSVAPKESRARIGKVRQTDTRPAPKSPKIRTGNLDARGAKLTSNNSGACSKDTGRT